MIMKKRVKNRKRNSSVIIAAVILILIVLVFLIGYFNWDKISGRVVDANINEGEGVAGGVSSAAVVKPVDGVSLSVATLKDEYKVKEKILLTDPPDEKSISGNVVEDVGLVNNRVTENYEGVINFNRMTRSVIDENGNMILEDGSKKIKSKGYIIEFEDKPLVLKEKELVEKAAPSGVAMIGGISSSAKAKLKTDVNKERTKLRSKKESIKDNIKAKLGKTSIK